MEIKRAKRGINKFGARKYAIIKSSSYPEKEYTIVKVRKKTGTRRHYKYVCSCPDHIFRQKECKHIKEFKKKER